MTVLDRFSLRDKVILLTGGSGLYGRQLTAAIAEAGVVLGEYSALSVKSSVVGYGRAEKSQVQLMVRTLTGQFIESEDAADAVAVAICHVTRTKIPLAVPVKVAAR